LRDGNAGRIILWKREYRFRGEGRLASIMAQQAFALSGSEPAMNTDGRLASLAINVLMFALWILFLSCAGAALARMLT
jgi:hypothetical protein